MAQEEELAALRKQLDAYRDRVPPAEPLRQFMRIVSRAVLFSTLGGRRERVRAAAAAASARRSLTRSPSPNNNKPKHFTKSREARLKNPEDVARFGATLLKHHKGALAEEERWLLHEQAAVAALEVGALPVAAGLARAVLERFPDSVRARRLQGLYYEAAGKLERAEEVYAAALRDAPSNEIMAKRMVSE
jgi:tetratricopeptide (TPR) repeat protein